MIRAYDDLVPQWDSAGRVRLTVEVSHGGKVVFPKGQLTCALHGTSDGTKARELVMSLVAITEHGEALNMEREARYRDQNGNVRKSA